MNRPHVVFLRVKFTVGICFAVVVSVRNITISSVFFCFFRSYAIHLHVYTRRPFRLYKILLRDVLYITYVYNNFYFNWILSCIHDLSYVSYRLIYAFPMSNHKWLSVTYTRTNSIRRVYYIFHTIIDLVRRVRIKIYIYIFSFRRPTPSPFRII